MDIKLFRKVLFQKFPTYEYRKQKILILLRHTDNREKIIQQLEITSDVLEQNLREFSEEFKFVVSFCKRISLEEMCQNIKEILDQSINISEREYLAVNSVFSAQTEHIQNVLVLFMTTNTYKEVSLALGRPRPNTISQHIRRVCADCKQMDIINEPPGKQESRKLKKLLNKHIENSTKEKIIKSLPDVSNSTDDTRQSDLVENTARKGIATFIISANKESCEYIWNILNDIKNIARDDSIKIEKKECGSIKLTISGTPEGCQRLKDLFDNGELTEIAGSRVIDVSSVEIVTEDSLWTNIRTWVQSNMIPNWDLEEIVGGTIEALRANPNFFGTPAFNSLRSSNAEERSLSISELLESLNSEDLNIVRLAAQKLGEIEANAPEVINSFKDKLNTIEDVQTQWQIALSLGIIAPEEHPQAKAQKQIIELGDTSLELIVATKNDEDDFVDILVEIRPDWDDYLPIGLEAKILEESGEEFWLDDIDFTRQVNDEQSYIYFSFWGTPGDRFILQLSLNNTMLRKNFQI